MNLEIKTLVTRNLQATNRFTLTDVESADAALKISVRGMRTSGSPDARSRAIMTLRLVDVNGRIVWPLAGTRREYAGAAESIAAKGISDLNRDIQNLESGRK